MRRRVRLRESDLRRLISESVNRKLRENEEYDLYEFEEDPEGTKEIENQISWDIKNGRDKIAMRNAYPDSMLYSDDGSENGYDFDNFGLTKDELLNAELDNDPYDNGYEGIFGDRDVSDEYFNDSDYRFTHDEWNEDDPLMNLDRAYEPTSDLNRRYNESKIRRIVRESLRRASRRRR